MVKPESNQLRRKPRPKGHVAVRIIAENPDAGFKLLLQHRPMFRNKLGDLYDILERFSAGLKGHETDTIANPLACHEETEKLLGGSIEARVLSLREQYKDDLDKAISDARSKFLTHIAEFIINTVSTDRCHTLREYQALASYANGAFNVYPLTHHNCR
jgi:hypothetical protein